MESPVGCHKVGLGVATLKHCWADTAAMDRLAILDDSLQAARAEPHLGLDDLCASVLDPQREGLYLLCWEADARRGLHRAAAMSDAALLQEWRSGSGSTAALVSASDGDHPQAARQLSSWPGQMHSGHQDSHIGCSPEPDCSPLRCGIVPDCALDLQLQPAIVGAPVRAGAGW